MKRKIIFFIQIFVFYCHLNCFAAIKEPEFAGQFYPGQKEELSTMVDNYLLKAQPKNISADIFMLISPHAGFGYSGQTAAYGYKLIQNKPYKTVIILGTSHHKPFSGAAVYAGGSFETSLGRLNIDDEFIKNLIDQDPSIFADESAFAGEHSVEVQLPFLKKVLGDFKIVPVIVGDCSLDNCKKIAALFKSAIGERKDILFVVSSDLYHGYDLKEALHADILTLDLIKKMDYQELYYSLRDSKAQACGGLAVVIALNIVKNMGAHSVEVLNHTNSAAVTGESKSGQWIVGYASIAVFNSATPAEKETRTGALLAKGENMLNNQQREKLLKIARQSISTHLETGKLLELSETDPILKQKMGAFVTLNKHKELRGCIGSFTSSEPLYLTVRDMAVASAEKDPRFSKLSFSELKDLDIEISVLSPLRKVDSADEIILGKHGVLVRKGYQSGVFLPQVATETGWSKDEFLNNLCAHKAGLPSDAWKDKETELYIFDAEVFSEGGEEQ